MPQLPDLSELTALAETRSDTYAQLRAHADQLAATLHPGDSLTVGKRLYRVMSAPLRGEDRFRFRNVLIGPEGSILGSTHTLQVHRGSDWGRGRTQYDVMAGAVSPTGMAHASDRELDQYALDASTLVRGFTQLRRDVAGAITPAKRGRGGHG